jgi:apolipoprotein N-acyltransferase
MYYDAFNSAISIKKNKPIQLYNKSKLVPGVETLPTYLKWLDFAFEKFGGTTSGYGKDTGAVYFTIDSNIKSAPIICYESVYGEYVAEYVRKGSNLLTIMTNDGWWGNTPGYKQHLQYARLRAIETNCYVVRSANTGISAVIDNYGNIIEQRVWDIADVIKTNISIAQHPPTFYVQHGDWLYKIFVLVACVGLLIYWVMLLFNKNKYTNQ